MIGRKLGHYEIVEKLGQGGMGQVFRAHDTKLGREVALKLLPESLARDPERLARLSREAQLLASLNHPNVATLHGLEDSEELRYLVMELVSGETLAEQIARGALGVEESLSIFRQIAEALEAAHEKGIVHRDLKPANVIVTPEGRIKVLDFGLAKAVTGEAPASALSDSPTLTREGTLPGVILGTAFYMSPEQARGKTLDRRTDIWSFGCVFYEALSGRKAFSGETVSDVIAAILEREPDWTALPANTPKKVRDLLRWCLEKDPRRRLRDIGDGRIEVDEPEPAPAPRHRHLPWAVAAAASTLALWSFLRPAAEIERPVSRFTVTPPLGQSLGVGDPFVAISPDGTRLVYAAGTDDIQIYVRPIDRLEAVPVPGTAGGIPAFFSPDGQWLVFYTVGKLQKVRLDSGLPVPLCDAPDPAGASWGAGDVILFAETPRSGLSRTSASGGAVTVVTTPDAQKGEFSHLWPEILPGGKSALFTIRTTAGSSHIGLVSLETGAYRVLVEDASFARYGPTNHLLYVRDGTILAAPFDLERLELAGEPVPVLEGVETFPALGSAQFAVSPSGTLAYVPRFEAEGRLVWVDRAGSVQPITDTQGDFSLPRLSPDGRKLSLTMWGEGRSHIRIYDIDRDSFARVTSEGNAWEAIWTPDGKRLTFRQGEPNDLYWLPADGSGSEERLTASPGSWTRPNSWTPDGRELLYTETESPSAGDIWALTPGAEPRPILQTAFFEQDGIVSPDGRFLAYISNETGRNEVYVRPYPGPGARWPISNAGGEEPRWSGSGREIFYRNGDKMMAVSIETQPSFRAAKPVVLFEGKFLSGYDVTPDGQRFVMVESEESFPTRIEVVLNWHEELKERVPASPR